MPILKTLVRPTGDRTHAGGEHANHYVYTTDVVHIIGHSHFVLTVAI